MMDADQCGIGEVGRELAGGARLQKSWEAKKYGEPRGRGYVLNRPAYITRVWVAGGSAIRFSISPRTLVSP